MKKIAKSFSQQTGSMMLEVLAVIALMILITPMIYTRTTEYAYELEDGVTASKLRLLRQGIYTYMEMNYDNIVSGEAVVKTNGVTKAIGAMDENDKTDYTLIDIDDPELSRFIRPSYHEDSKYFDNVKVSLKRERIDEHTIIINSMIATVGSGNKTKINPKQGYRIASLVGSEAGYTESREETSGGKTITKLTARGPGGFFEIDVGTYFSTAVSDAGQIVLSTGYFPPEIRLSDGPAGEGDFLFRKAVPGHPAYETAKALGKAHMMETDIDFGQYTGANVTGGFNVTDLSKAYGKKYLENTDEDLENFRYKDNPDDDTEEGYITYGIDFSTHSALLDDIRIASLGGARITEVLPSLILMAIYQDIDFGYYVPKEGYDNPRVLRKASGCPTGYSKEYRLIQKEALAGSDILALASHAAPYNTGIHSAKSWLRNNKLRRSTHYDGSTAYYRIYGNNAAVKAECKITGNSYNCGAFENYKGDMKVSEVCSYNTSTRATSTIYYDISDPNNNGDPYSSGMGNVKKMAEYSGNITRVYATATTNVNNAVLSCNNGSCKCYNQSYCPGYPADGSSFTVADPTPHFAQHGACQAAINTARSSKFIPYDTASKYKLLNAEGNIATEIEVTSTTTIPAGYNVAPASGIYYNTRVLHRMSDLALPAGCLVTDGAPVAGTLIESSTKGLCEESTAEPKRRYTILPVRYDLYYYCKRN